MRGLLIPVDGEPRDVEYGDWRTIAGLVDAEYVQRVSLVPTVALYVDESGLLRNQTLNPTASLLYSTTRRAGGVIAGPALLVREGWTNDPDDGPGIDNVDAHPEWLRRVLDQLLGLAVPA